MELVLLGQGEYIIVLFSINSIYKNTDSSGACPRYDRYSQTASWNHLITINAWVAVSKFVTPLEAPIVIVPDPSLFPRALQIWSTLLPGATFPTLTVPPGLSFLSKSPGVTLRESFTPVIVVLPVLVNVIVNEALLPRLIDVDPAMVTTPCTGGGGGAGLTVIVTLLFVVVPPVPVAVNK